MQVNDGNRLKPHKQVSSRSIVTMNGLLQYK